MTTIATLKKHAIRVCTHRKKILAKLSQQGPVYNDIKFSKEELQKLFHFATSQSHFLFDGQYYDQIDGVAMGSPLGPVLANLCMAYHEKDWIKNYRHQAYSSIKDMLMIFFVQSKVRLRQKSSWNI